MCKTDLNVVTHLLRKQHLRDDSKIDYNTVQIVRDRLHEHTRIEKDTYLGFTDSKGNIKATVEFAKEIDSLVGIEPLAYHSIGAIKYERLGREYKLKDLRPSDEGRIREINSMIKSLDVQLFDKYFYL